MLDVLCIGNATRDVFIQLPRLPTKKQLRLPSGSKVPVKSITVRTGGGATNTAVAFSRLGLKTGVFAAVGRDEFAPAIRAKLSKEKVSMRHLVVSKKYHTAYSAILTGFGGDRVILTHGGATPHLLEAHVPWRSLKARLAYCTSLHAKPALLKKLFSHLSKNNTAISFNPGTSELKQGLKKLLPLLKKTSILFLNVRELRTLFPKKSRAQAMRALQEHVPLVVCTHGKKGAWAFDGNRMHFQRAFKVKVLDTTGSGDAFGAAFTAAFLLKKPLKECLRWGAKNAASVVKFPGAKEKLLRRKQISH